MKISNMSPTILMRGEKVRSAEKAKDCRFMLYQAAEVAQHISTSGHWYLP